MGYLKDLRLRKGFTTQYMADILEISKPFYWQLENMNRRLSYDMAIKIANIFDSKPDKIFYDDYKKQVRKKAIK